MVDIRSRSDLRRALNASYLDAGVDREIVLGGSVSLEVREMRDLAQAYPEVTHLHFQGKQDFEVVQEGIEQFSALKGLEYRGSRGRFRVSPTLRLPASLELLQLEQLPNLDFHGILSQLPKLQHLEVIECSGTALNIDSLPRPTALVSIAAWSNRELTIESIEKASNLEYVDVSTSGSNHWYNEPGGVSLTFLADVERHFRSHVGTGHTDLSAYSALGEELLAKIGQLPQLKFLNVGGRGLRHLPRSIREHPQLKVLIVSDNQLSDPLEISAELRALIAQNNLLESLPIVPLDGLGFLALSGNRIPLPDELLQRSDDPRSIYALSGSSQLRPINRAKVILVGEPSVGKTSLAKRLRSLDEFDEDESMTAGIEVSAWRAQVDDRTIDLDIWDFGGQEIMHATHQFFMTRRSAYLVVLDNRLSEAQNRLYYWLDLVTSYAESAPILVIGNKSDVASLDLDRRGLKRSYPSILAFMNVSCRSNLGVDDVVVAVTSAVGNLPHVADLVPEDFFNLLESLSDMDREHISHEEFTSLCVAQNITDGRNQASYLELLHDLGVVLSFRDDDRLMSRSILRPDWVTTGVYALLNSNMASQQRGILSFSDVCNVLKPLGYDATSARYILDLMRRFELCFGFEGDDKHYVPDLIGKEEPYTGDWEDSLTLRVEFSTLPSSVVSRLIVRLNRLIKDFTFWRFGAVLAHEGDMLLLVSNQQEREIALTVRSRHGAASPLLAIVRNQIADIMSGLPAIDYKELVAFTNGRREVRVSLQHLFLLQSQGIDEFIPEGATDRVAVSQLIGGLADLKSQAIDRRGLTVLSGLGQRAEGEMTSREVSGVVISAPYGTVTTTGSVIHQSAVGTESVGRFGGSQLPDRIQTWAGAGLVLGSVGGVVFGLGRHWQFSTLEAWGNVGIVGGMGAVSCTLMAFVWRLLVDSD